MTKSTVTLNDWGRYGYAEYNDKQKTVNIVLERPEVKEKVNAFFNKELTLEIPKGDNLQDFVAITINPLESEKNFNLALTKLWVNTDVKVEWSMPPGMAENL